MKPNWHYYEAHVNLGEMDTIHKVALPEVLNNLDFKTTDIVNLPIEGLEQEDFDTIITTKSDKLEDIKNKVYLAVVGLTELGYKVNRYKIESTIIDSKFDDKWELL
jgi:hypothetical protein